MTDTTCIWSSATSLHANQRIQTQSNQRSEIKDFRDVFEKSWMCGETFGTSWLKVAKDS